LQPLETFSASVSLPHEDFTGHSGGDVVVHASTLGLSLEPSKPPSVHRVGSGGVCTYPVHGVFPSSPVGLGAFLLGYQGLLVGNEVG